MAARDCALGRELGQGGGELRERGLEVMRGGGSSIPAEAKWSAALREWRCEQAITIYSSPRKERWKLDEGTKSDPCTFAS